MDKEKSVGQKAPTTTWKAGRSPDPLFAVESNSASAAFLLVSGVVGHCHRCVERTCEREAGTRIYAQAKGIRDLEPDLRISRGFGKVINAGNELEPRARDRPRVRIVRSSRQSL
jgi:hypothetical protein